MIIKPFCTIGFLALVMSARAAFALDPLEQSLVDKAGYWEQKGRGDLASESWKKLLQVDPNQPDALTGQGIYEAQQGHAIEARKYLDALRKSHPGHPGIRKIERAIEMGRLDTGKLNREIEDARRLAGAHRYDEAVARYRQIFSGSPPQGDLALEYYQTLAGTKNGWDEARRGLEALMRSDPQNARYSLAYARHLSYREGTRREAIAILSKLAGNSNVAAEAKSAWRQTLIWLTASRADNSLYREYLSRYPEDNAVKARFSEINRPTPLDAASLAREKAFKALQGGGLDAAEAGFERALRKKPSDADAVAGLAVIKLRQQEFKAARDLFRKAMRMAPHRRGSWNAGYRTASLWLLMGQAQNSRLEPKKAESLLREALVYDSGEHVARLALANLLLEEGKLPDAEKNYRQVLSASPDNPDALGGLANVLVRQGRRMEAQKLIDSMGEGHPLLRAKLAEATGDYPGAQAALENAMLADPASPWIRLELARVYRKQGEVAQARSLIDGLLESDPQMPDALYASALLSGEAGQWRDGLMEMEKIRPQDRTPAMFDTQRRLWIQAEVERAIIFSRQGNGELALSTLKQAESAAGKSMDLLGIVASGYAQAGRDGEALAIMRHAISASSAPSAGMRLQYASILFKTRQDVELGPLLNQMSLTADTLGAREREDLDKLRAGFALRQADLARENGNLARAYDFLSPELAVHPGDARLQMALARIYNAAGDYATALSIYQGVLEREPGNVDAMLSAAGAAIDARDYATAGRIVGEGLNLEPQNPRLLGLAGKLARIQGKDEIAIQYFKKALALERGQPVGTGGLRLVEPMPIRGVPSLQSAPSGNPFSGVRPTRYPALPAFPQPSNPDDLKAIPLTAAPAPAPSFASDRVPVTAAAPAPIVASRAATVMQGDVPRRIVDSAPAGNKNQSLQQELDDLRMKYSNNIGVGMALRNRSGEIGMSQLLDLEFPVRGEIHTGYSGTLAITATPVTLSAGDLNMTDPNVAVRFGSNAVSAAIPAGSIAQNASGIGLGLAYQVGSLTGDVGITPLSFPKTNFVGGVKLETKIDDDLSFGAGFSRRPVTDSVLSYAGAVDPRTGQMWGGVTSNGLHLNFGYDSEAIGAYANMGFHRLIGTNVESNNKFDASVGTYYYAIRNEDDILTVGANITSESYTKNLRYFTLGHGGYFSPQSYFSLGIPVDWSGRKEKLAYQVRTTIGIQSFREDSVPYFPLDSNLQATLQNLALANPALATNYSGRNVTGFAYMLAGSVEYQIAPKFFLGGAFSMDNASNYNQQIGLAYLRYSFMPQAGKVVYPPRIVKPYYLEQP